MTSDRRLRSAVLLLSALGAGVAAYLTYAHVAHVQVACATGGCESVQTSRYAELAGVPVAALGLAGYVLLAATACSRSDVARAVGVAAALGGFAFGLYLVYVQVGVLHAFCQWCLTSDGLLTLLVPVTLLRLRDAGVSRAAPGGPPAGASSRRARPPAGRARRSRAARAPARR
jgi:uncharacterized membrane protein